MTSAALETTAAPASGPGPAGADSLEQIADFLTRACKAEELDERLELDSASAPVQRVVESLNAFLDKLWAQQFQLGAKQEMLEKVVEIRTSEVHEILDHVSTGFLLTLRDESVFDNFSRSCLDIFGVSDLKGQKLSALMGLGENARAHFSLCYEQIFDDFLPAQVSIGQLPPEFTIGSRIYQIQGAPIFGKDGQVAKVFFTVNDTTELRKVEAENTLRQALLEIVRQKDTFRTFLQETSKAFEAARQSPSQVRSRTLLHTIKGNLGCYGLHEIAALVHSIEDAPEITPRHLASVEDTLKKFMQIHRAVIGIDYPAPDRGARTTEIERLRPILETMVAEDSRGAREAVVEDFLAKVSWVKAGALLAPLRGVVDRVARRLEKSVSFEITGQDMLVDPERVGAVFTNLNHLVRNSVDHGIELPEQRGKKPACGRITVACRENQDDWILEVADDGRGIDVDAVGAAAVAGGRLSATTLQAMSRDERLRLIFLDGVTTRESATQDSGRGVGTTALRDSLDAAHGKVDIVTVPGEGTRITVRIPRH